MVSHFIFGAKIHPAGKIGGKKVEAKQCDQKKNCQMSVKVVQKWFHQKNDRFWHLYKKMPKNVRDLGKSIIAKGFKNLPKVQQIAQSGLTEAKERETDRKKANKNWDRSWRAKSAESWRTLVAGDGQPYRPRGKSSLEIMHLGTAEAKKLTSWPE